MTTRLLVILQKRHNKWNVSIKNEKIIKMIKLHILWQFQSL